MSLKVFNAYKLPVEMAYDSSKLMAFLNGIRGKENRKKRKDTKR